MVSEHAHRESVWLPVGVCGGEPELASRASCTPASSPDKSLRVASCIGPRVHGGHGSSGDASSSCTSHCPAIITGHDFGCDLFSRPMAVRVISCTDKCNSLRMRAGYVLRWVSSCAIPAARYLEPTVMTTRHCNGCCRGCRLLWFKLREHRSWLVH